MEALTQIVKVIWPENPDQVSLSHSHNCRNQRSRLGGADGGCRCDNSRTCSDIRTSFDDADVLIAP
jgi:hypothetical protein